MQAGEGGTIQKALRNAICTEQATFLKTNSYLDKAFSGFLVYIYYPDNTGRRFHHNCKKMPGLRTILTFLKTSALLFVAVFSAGAQNCPPNIDFENGDFSGWTCYTGHTSSGGSENIISFSYSGGPVSNQHTMYSSNPGDGYDEYGNFPINCPNGSGHSIRLGNNSPGNEAEGVSYDFTIPAGTNVYNLIYNYAVVFQDPGHLPSEQPRLVIEITNVTDNKTIDCSSFTFFANGTILPGFELSDNPGGNTPVWFKRWTAVSINLDNLAGKTIRLFFKTADCTFRRHFGYAYVDVNTECSDKFEGAEFCPDDTSVFVTAPYGYQDYTWYNNTFTQSLGTGQTLTFMPPPLTGTTVAVILNPYNGYGCLDTLYADLTNTLNYTANAGADKASCNNSIVQLGSPPKAGFTYNWVPSAGLNNASISNPLANPGVTTEYVLYVAHSGGGCASTDTAIVTASVLDNSLIFLGKTSWCIGSGDSSVLVVNPADSIQWYRDNIPITGANQPTYHALQSGTYHATVFNNAGCVLNTVSQAVSITSVPVAGISLSNPDQCLKDNQFIFTNNSSNSLGTMSYEWTMGDGNIFTSRNLTYSYLQPGSYDVKMIVRSSNVCADSSSIHINVWPNVEASFTAAPVCINLPFQPVNNTAEPPGTTIFYSWDLANGQTSSLRIPPPVSYSSAGNYRLKLTVSSAQCPLPLHTTEKLLRVDKPAVNQRYPVKYAVVNLPLALQARPIGNNVLWTPAANLSNSTIAAPVFLSSTQQEYNIQLTTASGCITVDTQLVKINKEIVIYVPNSFTPNNDGTNDLLRPFMIGIKQLNFFRIYNRWGQLIFETTQVDAGWDGLYRQRPAEMQTVVWMLQGIGADDKTYNTKGSSTLIR